MKKLLTILATLGALALAPAAEAFQRGGGQSRHHARVEARRGGGCQSCGSQTAYSPSGNVGGQSFGGYAPSSQAASAGPEMLGMPTRVQTVTAGGNCFGGVCRP